MYNTKHISNSYKVSIALRNSNFWNKERAMKFVCDMFPEYDDIGYSQQARLVLFKSRGETDVAIYDKLCEYYKNHKKELAPFIDNYDFKYIIDNIYVIHDTCIINDGTRIISF